MNTQMSQQEIENQIIELFSLLEETFKGKDNKKIKESMNKLNEIYKKNPSNINILFLALSYKSIAGRELTLNNHKSVALYLKNLLLSKKNENPEIIFSYLNKIFELIFEKSKENPYLNNYSIISSFQSIIQNLLSFKNMLDKKDYLEKLFNSILNYIQNENTEYFLAIAKSVILFCTSLLTSKCADDTNYNQLINSYYIPIIDIIFSNVPKYLNPKNNMYNIEFITIIKLLLDGFYNNLQKTKGIFQNDTIKEISMMFFKKYGSYCYELLQLMPEFDLDTKNKFGSPNPIIVFNQNEKLCYELNNMKGKAIQFISFITQISTLKEQYENEDIKNYIKDKDLQQIIKDIMALIMRSFQDILNSKEKYNYIRKNFDEKNDEEDITNMLLYQICVFLTRALIREPIKSELKSNMKQFLLNIFFPLIVSSEDETSFIENDPEGYHQYINDITFKFKNQNFRTSGCFLVKKICEEYEDIDNFVISFFLEMLNYIINEGQVKSEIAEYNIYLKYQKSACIDQFNEKIKLDFSLLIFLILKQKIIQNEYLRNRLFNILVNNYQKLHLIQYQIIQIKLCKIYYNYLPRFFNEGTNIQKEKKRQFIENVINYLLNCIVQKNIQINNEYCQALSYDASTTIMELMNMQTKSEKEDNELKNYISKILEDNFGILNILIFNIDYYTYFSLIQQIIETIKINKRNLIFECLSNLTTKFIENYSKPNNENKLFYNQYFNIISSFLLGENKILSNNEEEILKFNEIFDPVLNYINNTKDFLYYDQLVSTMEKCIKCFDGINERSILVLNNINNILIKDSCMSQSSYNFVSTFLSHIQKNKSKSAINERELLNTIIELIRKSFSFEEETFKSSNIFALLLTLQILDINPNLNTDIFAYLILKSYNCFEQSNEIINQLVLANIGLGFIFKPELTLEILKKKISYIRNGVEIGYIRFEKYIGMICDILNISYPSYYPPLGKCIILGICSIFSNKVCQDYLNQNIEFKKFLLTTFINLILSHKHEKTLILEKLMKKELECNFVEENEDNESDNDDDWFEDDEFHNNIEQALSANENIKSSDEFKFFSEIIKNIKENDKPIYEFILSKIKSGENLLERICQIRNIKVKYNNKELTVPRKIVKIIRK